MREFYPSMLYQMSEEKKNYFCIICTQRIGRLFIADTNNEDWAQNIINLVNLISKQVVQYNLDLQLVQKYQKQIEKLVDRYLYLEDEDEDDNDLYTVLVGEGATIIQTLIKIILSKGREKDENMIILLNKCTGLMRYLSNYDSRAQQKEEKWEIDAFKIIYDSKIDFPIDKIDSLSREADDSYIRWVENNRN